MGVDMVLLGDCLELMEDIPDCSIDMILCDLPYGTTQCSWDSIIPFEPLWKQYERITKKNAAIVLTASQPFTSALVMSNIKIFRYCWYWLKSQSVGHLNAYKMPMKNIEDICVFYNKQCEYNPILKDKDPQNIRPETKKRSKSNCYGAHSKESVRGIPKNKSLPNQLLKFNNTQDNLHPTQKPLDLFGYLIKTYTKEGDMVLDNCAGSGTTAVACIQTKRNYILMEKDKKYYELIKKRIANTTPPLIKKT